MIARSVKALADRNIEGWEADRDGPAAAITGRLKETTLVVTLGGDGTFLAGARLAAPRGIPVLGVNLGRLGFLTELESEQVEDGLARFLDGAYRIEERTILQVTVRREGTYLWYRADTDALQEILNFLYQECCTRSRAVALEAVVQISQQEKST